MIFARRSAPDAPAVHRPPWQLAVGVALFAVAIVGGVAAAVSYSHMLEWATQNGNAGANVWRARVFPISVDGAMIAASTVLYADARAGRETVDWVPWVVLGLGALTSVGANVLHTWISPWADKLIAAWPPVALTISVEMLLRFLRRVREAVDARAEAEAQRAQRVARRTERRSGKAVPASAPVPAPRTEAAPSETAVAAGDDDDEGASVVVLHAESGDAPERPHWLIHGMSARDAMFAYLRHVNPDATGAELDREVGAPFFNTAAGYGRQVVRAWKTAQEVSDGAAEEVR